MDNSVQTRQKNKNTHSKIASEKDINDTSINSTKYSKKKSFSSLNKTPISDSADSHDDFSDKSSQADDITQSSDDAADNRLTSPVNAMADLSDKLRKTLDVAYKRRMKIEQLEKTILELKAEKARDTAENQTPRQSAEAEAAAGDDEVSDKASGAKTKVNYKLIALFVVIFLPAVLVFFYTAFFYDSMYISSATFTIKSNSAEKGAEGSSPMSFLGGGGNSDISTASAYIQSLDMFFALDSKLKLQDHFSSHDIVSSLSKEPTQSDIQDYWKSMVNVNIDTESALMQLEVKAYSPEFAQKLTQGILDELDLFINKMNEKMTQDSIKLASVEVEKAKKDIEDISDKMRQFRDQHTFIDPASEASNLLSIISNLENLITQAKAELAQKRAYLREDSVDIVSLKTKIASLEQEVTSLRSRIALNVGEAQGNGQKALGNVLTRTLGEFEQLNIEYQFAQKILETALNNLDTTRQLSLSKSKYLVTIDNPKIPDESLWPRPFVATIVTFVVTLFLLSAVSLLISAIKEHMGI